jgi:hypothetical protein
MGFNLVFKGLNTYIYHHLPPTCFGVCYTIFRETIAILAQELYAFCNVVTQGGLQNVKCTLFVLNLQCCYEGHLESKERFAIKK